MKNIVILLLVAIVAWFASAIVRLENQRYAMEIGMCGNFEPERPESIGKRSECLAKVQTRTNSAYNLLYGLKII